MLANPEAGQQKWQEKGWGQYDSGGHRDYCVAPVGLGRGCDYLVVLEQSLPRQDLRNRSPARRDKTKSCLLDCMLSMSLWVEDLYKSRLADFSLLVSRSDVRTRLQYHCVSKLKPNLSWRQPLVLDQVLNLTIFLWFPFSSITSLLTCPSPWYWRANGNDCGPFAWCWKCFNVNIFYSP